MTRPNPLWQIVLPAVIICFSLAGCKSAEHPGQAGQTLPTAPVAVAEARLQPIDNQVEIVGTVQAVNRAEIAAKISGNIADLPVVLGSEVRQGQLLVEINAAEIGTRLQQAQTQLDQARRNLDREQKLLQKNAATAESVKSLRESLRIAESAHREAQIFQEYTRLLAPFAGRVTRKFANLGDLATPGKALLQIENESRLQVVAEVPEAMILHIKDGDQLKVTIPAADLSIPGTVAEIAPIADPQSRTVSVKLTIAPQARIHSGQFARVAFSLSDITTLAIPSQAILPFGQLERVFVVVEGIARLRLVKSGAATKGDSREILAGLTPGEKVVVSGQATLVDGQPVSLP